MRKILSIFLFISFITGFGQNIYKDRITDDNGNPMARIKVQVQGNGNATFSDINGEFSIKANVGDIIILSKDGEEISSYQLDGRLNYFVEDERTTSISKKFTQNYLDSAKIISRKDPFKSIDFVEKHLKSKKKYSTNELALAYSILGNNYQILKQFDLAIGNYLKSLQSVEDVSVQLNLAKAYSQAGKFLESTTLYKSILAKKNDNSKYIAAYEGMGDNYNIQNLNDESLKAFRLALDIAKKNKIQGKISELNTKIAEILAKKGSKQESNVYLQNTLRSSENEPFQKRVAVQNQMAEIYQTNKDYDSEIEIRKKTITELERAKVNKVNPETTPFVLQNYQNENKIYSNKEISISQLNLEIGRAYIDKKEYDNAIPYLEKSAINAKEFKDLEVEKNAMQKLSELYKNIGNSKKALEKYQEYALLVDQLYQQKEVEINDALSMSNELREKENRINSLEKDRILSESQYKLNVSEQQLTAANFRRQKMLIYAMSIGLLLLGISVFAMYRSNKQTKIANNLLALKSLRSQMNPHFIFNALNSVNNFIAQNDERAANRYLTEFSTLMRNVLNNSELDFIPLEKEIELIKLYTQLEHSRFTDKFDYELVIDDNLDDGKFNIPPMLIQPYVENAVWHGLRYRETKGKLSIEFFQKDTQTVVITITDDGIGRTKSKELKTQNQKKQESKGMLNVKKRIQILNEMYSEKVSVNISDLALDGSGTKVVVILKA